MFFLIIFFFFCFFLYKLCSDKGISPWGYLTAFIAGFVFILVVTAVVTIFLYGPNVMNDPDAQKKIQSLSPFAMMFHFLLFLFFRRKIERLPDYHDDDDNNHTPPNDGKKDLSYFR